MSAFKPVTALLFLFAFVLGASLSIEGKQLLLPGSPEFIYDSCRPEIKGAHFSIYCMETSPAAALTAPVVRGVCEAVESLVSEEHFIDLGCSNTGLTGYFSPSQWMVSTIKGDGGVDVTGAPNALLVEGANNAIVSAAANERTRMQIRVPADGLVAFNWTTVGGSNLLKEEFKVIVDERSYTPVRRAQSNGRFRAPVRSGDLLALEFSPQSQMSIQIEEFRLLSSAAAVIQRQWTATDKEGHANTFTQFISIEQPNISDIVFPMGTDKALASPQDTHPCHTGYPYIDLDGNPATTEDRHLLSGKDCTFEVTYTDELQQTEKGTFLHRHWKVSDPCRENTMRETQIIKLTDNPASGTFPEEDWLEWLKNPFVLPAIPEIDKSSLRRLTYTEELMTL